MGFVKTEYTSIRNLHIDSDVEVMVKLHSYKDGTVEAVIEDSVGSISLDFELVELSNKFFKQHLHIPLKKLLHFHNVKYKPSILLTLNSEIRTLVYGVKNFNGRPTLNYDIYDCHAMVVLKRTK